MAKYCTNCGNKLNENTALCLNCGVLVENNTTKSTNNNKNQKKKGLPTWAIVLIIVGSILLLPLIFIIVVGIMAYNVVNNTISNVKDYIEEENITQTGTIGDTLITDEFDIKLNNAVIYQSIGIDENNLDIPSEGKEYLVFFFDVKNISDDNEYISEYDFTGYVDGYEVETTSLYNDIEGIKELDANLPPNKKVNGYVAFEIDSSWQEFEIHYKNWFYSSEVIFKVTNPNNNIENA